VRVEFKTSFVKDLQQVNDKALLKRVRQVIEEVELAKTLTEIPNLKKLKGRGDYYRIRIGDHRLGITLASGTLVLVRFLNRRDIYRYFP
jgi:mRNA interferase RelE/StbE